jgi:hypothetical protein
MILKEKFIQNSAFNPNCDKPEKAIPRVLAFFYYFYSEGIQNIGRADTLQFDPFKV